jgi:DNA invertase Pin-like site-specific DNA recombinase
MRLVGYLRVSTEGQAEDGYGLDVQRTELSKWAKSSGHRIVAWTQDAGVSGAKGLDCRFGLADAIDKVEARECDGIAVYRLDRLARDLVLQEQLLADVRRKGGRIFTASAAESHYLDDDANDPSRQLIRQVLGAVSGYERSMIALRMSRGRARKAHQGGYAYGAPPFGMQATDRELVEHPVERETTARIVELRAGGASLRAIVDTLASEGRPAKRGGAWHPRTVQAVLASQAADRLVA